MNTNQEIAVLVDALCSAKSESKGISNVVKDKAVYRYKVIIGNGNIKEGSGELNNINNDAALMHVLKVVLNKIKTKLIDNNKNTLYTINIFHSYRRFLDNARNDKNIVGIIGDTAKLSFINCDNNTEFLSYNIKNEMKKMFYIMKESYESVLGNQLKSCTIKNENLVSNNDEYQNVIFFDLETNGTSKNRSPSEILSVAAIKAKFKLNENKEGEVVDVFERYYFPYQHNYNMEAISINGLTESVLMEKRNNVTYSEYYMDDEESFLNFCNGCNMVVGHNIISFDSKWVNLTNINMFDTMKENKYIVNVDAPKYPRTPEERLYMYNMFAAGVKVGKKYLPKNPKLSEVVEFYKIPIESDKLHSSLYDTECCLKIFNAMIVHPDPYINKKPMEFLRRYARKQI